VRHWFAATAEGDAGRAAAYPRQPVRADLPMEVHSGTSRAASERRRGAPR